MHELGIANSVLEAVQTEAALHPGARPVKVALRVGELSGVDPDALSFSFEVLVAGTPWERLALQIETKPREHRCPSCGVTFRVTDYNFACPECGVLRTACISGDELELAYLEFEES
jgi:hydrogenase nickel incorporation protein HypA/HybF